MTYFAASHPPHDFGPVFVQMGWRGVERIFGARTSVNKRWLVAAGEARLKQLRLRYRRGDLAALDEVMPCAFEITGNHNGSRREA